MVEMKETGPAVPKGAEPPSPSPATTPPTMPSSTPSPPTTSPSASSGSARSIDLATFEASFGESLERVLALETWIPGDDFGAILNELRRQIGDSVRKESGYHQAIRSVILPRIRERQAVKGAGVFQATEGQLRDAHRQVLLNGGVEACDATVVTHDALPLTVTRIGVCRVRYDGSQHKYAHQLYRRDVRLTEDDLLQRTLDFLERRRQRAAIDADDQRDALSELSRRGLMAYAERAVLTYESDSIWRMGHGTPMPLELLSGSGSFEFFEASVKVVRELVESVRRFVFVPSAPRERHLLTIGQSLEPLEFVVVENMQARMQRMIDGNLRHGPAYHRLARKFVDEVGSQIAMGVFRVSAAAPPSMFYAHVDHVHEAALVAMADSALQSHRGFPLLIDLADRLCQLNFGQDAMRSVAQEAYADVGAPFRYISERGSREKG